MPFAHKLAPVFKGRLISFGVIGGIGFAVDAGILQTLFVFGIKPLLARCVSFPVAVTTTWLLNNYYTFGDRPQTAAKSRYALYVAGQVMGALINVGVFMLTIRNWPMLSDKPVIPLIVGSALALVFNYTWANVLVFRLSQAADARSGSSTR